MVKTIETVISFSFSYSDGGGKTCESCRQYRRSEDYDPEEGTYDGLTQVCRQCIEASVGTPVVWHTELTGLGDNDSAWTYWERDVPDGPALVADVLTKTKHKVTLEVTDTTWSRMVRWAGQLPKSVTGRRPKSDDVYLLYTWRIPEPMDRVATAAD